MNPTVRAALESVAQIVRELAHVLFVQPRDHPRRDRWEHLWYQPHFLAGCACSFAGNQQHVVPQRLKHGTLLTHQQLDTADRG